MSSYTVPYIPNSKEIAPAVPEIRVPETRRIFFVFRFSRHTVECVSGQEIRAGTPVCYLRNRSTSRFQPVIIQKLWHLFLPNLHILMSSYTVPYIPNLKDSPSSS